MTPRDTQLVTALVEGGLISLEEAGQLERAQELHKQDTGEHRPVWDLAIESGVVTAAQAARYHQKAAESGAGGSAADSEAVTIVGGDTQNLAPHQSALRRAIAAAKSESEVAAAASGSGGTRLGGYRLVSKLGQGGMGAVYKAVQESMDRTVAIKVLPRNLASNQDFIGRFLREARAAGRLSHTNIVAGIDAGFADGYYYFAMEFVEGQNLGERLNVEGAISEEDAVGFAMQIADALEHAHEEGLVHRDVKPENILIGVKGEAKLCDLGLARSTEGDMRLTQAGMAVGTAYYMSPEQARGEEPEFSADIYSLGATLFHLVTGRPPFEGENSMQVMHKHINEPPPTPGEVLPGAVSPALESVILRMLAKSPDGRHESMAEVRADLEKVLSGGVPASLTRSIAERRRSSQNVGTGHSTRGARSTRSARPISSRAVSAVAGEVAESTAARRSVRRKSSSMLLPVCGAVAILLVIAALSFVIVSGGDSEESERKPGAHGPRSPIADPGSKAGPPSVPETPRIPETPVVPLTPATPKSPKGPAAFTASWKQLNISGPAARLVACTGMAYDSKRKRCFLWGGSWPHHNDLWVLELGTPKWTCLQETDNAAPGLGVERPKRESHPNNIWMIYDDKNDLYWIGRQWAYDPNGGKWQKYDNDFKGFSDYGWWVRPGWAYLPGSGKVMATRGVPALLDLKARTGEAFTRGPSTRYVDGGLVYDPASKVFVFFGGHEFKKKSFNDTWLFDLGTKAWTELKPRVSPPARSRHRLIWHGGINAVVMAGGVIDKKYRQDLWVFETEGRKWTEVTTAQQPIAVWAAMAYDAASDAIASFNKNGETWLLRISRKSAIK